MHEASWVRVKWSRVKWARKDFLIACGSWLALGPAQVALGWLLGRLKWLSGGQHAQPKQKMLIELRGICTAGTHVANPSEVSVLENHTSDVC